MTYGWQRVVVMGLALLLGAVASAAEPRRLALVIGNGAYTEGALTNPVHDAGDIAAKLRTLGFEVELHTDADQRAMDKAIHAFTGRLGGEGSVGLFYFAGHGVEHEGRNYLIPVGATIAGALDLRYEAVDAGRVLDGMDAAGNGLNLVVLDACRNNPYRSVFRSASRGLARMAPAKGALILYATQPGAVASDGEGRNGVFTKHLLAAIGEPGLEVEQVFKRAALAVDRESGGKQTPWVEGVVLGQFRFVPEPVAAAPAAPPAPITVAAPVQVPTQPAPPSVPPPPTPVQAPVGHLQVNVNVAGQVELDGRIMGSAAPGQPLNLSNLALGDHQFGVIAGGYLTQRRTTRIDNGRWTQEVVALVPEQAPAPAPAPVPTPVQAPQPPAAPRAIEQVWSSYPEPYRNISSPSFRCTGKLQPAEAIICGDPNLARADGVMGGMYRDLRAALGTGAAEDLRTTQRAWIKLRDRNCPTSAGDVAPGSRHDRAVSCLQRMVDERIGELWPLLQSSSRR